MIEKKFQLSPKEYILVKGARVNNLKNLDVAIPRNQLVVVTGLSGSGKSSLVFDTLYAEGQRKYVESLSSYARQFLGRMEKPEVDYIKGVSPAIAIEQRVTSRNPRSTVGTTTEIYDYLKLLFARVGKTYSPVSNQEVKKDSVSDIVDFITNHEEGKKLLITCPFQVRSDREYRQELETLLGKGYTRLLIEDNIVFIETLIDSSQEKLKKTEILIDRAVVSKEEAATFRFSDSVKTALFEGEGRCTVTIEGEEKQIFSDKFELDGMSFEEPSLNFFSFNNPYGACHTCQGFGNVLGIDPDLVIPNKTLSIYDGAIVPWKTEAMRQWVEPLLAPKFDFPIHRPIEALMAPHIEILWEGKGQFKGLHKFFSYLETKSHKIQYRVMLSRYKGKTVCPDCKGTKLRKDASYVKIDNFSITDLTLMPVANVQKIFEKIKIPTQSKKVAKRILIEINNRLKYLSDVGLEYLSLNRQTASLSGGEYQRIKLATSLGSVLVGAMYILDEPSIGLHPRDTERLIGILRALRDEGNSVIVVEHEEKIMLAADQIIDIGPKAGIHGGELVFQGTPKELMKSNSLTSKYLNGVEKIDIPKRRTQWLSEVSVKGVSENNLKKVNFTLPLGIMTVVTGVSGSGKSTLIRKVLIPAINKHLGWMGGFPGKYESLGGDAQKITQIEFVDQNPIGKSSRSNPVTYVKAYDAIRKLFSSLPEAKSNGLQPAHFSFNIEGGRCETCEGDGVVKIEMQFMADLFLTCEACKGHRFQKHILEITYQEKNIADVLALSIADAIDFFSDQTAIIKRLMPLQEVGLGYIKLGQGSNSLSGGEAQRVKLASFLGKGDKVSVEEHILFVFDEPTTGLHIHDIKKLLFSFNALVDRGNTVLVIEHNPEIVKNADWVVDLGPEGGEEGGYICFEGTPEALVKEENNHTGRHLKGKLLMNEDR